MRYLAAQNKFTTDDFERLRLALPRAIQSMPTWKATAAYIETFDEPQRTKPIEKSLLTVICVLAGVVTILSFVWGTW